MWSVRLRNKILSAYNLIVHARNYLVTICNECCNTLYYFLNLKVVLMCRLNVYGQEVYPPTFDAQKNLICSFTVLFVITISYRAELYFALVL